MVFMPLALALALVLDDHLQISGMRQVPHNRRLLLSAQCRSRLVMDGQQTNCASYPRPGLWGNNPARSIALPHQVSPKLCQTLRVNVGLMSL
jgi:hypothetical protein